ncbi:MAG: ADP-forming succinate--CoA ligase subunit beta [Candidatus Geothermarchaeales archaeon]
MKLYEYESKRIFTQHKIPIPQGEVASTPQEARGIAEEIGGPVVVKSQVLVAGRGKAGGIRSADTPEEAEAIAKELLGYSIKGFRVDRVLVEERASIARELYLSITLDRSQRRLTFLASREGGVDVEELALGSPESIIKLAVNPYLGLRNFEARYLSKALGFLGAEASAVDSTAKAFYNIAAEWDCELVESNPFALTTDGRFVALDARMIVDDNALFRHPNLMERMKEERRGMTELEVKAAEAGFSYVELDGDIGVVGNGAGLTMASMDAVSLYGGKPACFLDLGGGARAERVAKAVEIQLSHPKVKAILVNILGGITRCDEVAKGIVEALRAFGEPKPIVVRMIGTREDEGRKILLENGLSYLESMDEAAKEVVEAIRIKRR